MEKINDNIIRITGSASLPEPLVIDTDYEVKLNGSVIGIDKKSRQDGTFDFVYKLRLLTAEVLKDNGETIKSQGRKSNSKKLRDLIYFDYSESDMKIEFNQYYDAFYVKLLTNFEEVKEFLKNK